MITTFFEYLSTESATHDLINDEKNLINGACGKHVNGYGYSKAQCGFIAVVILLFSPILVPACFAYDCAQYCKKKFELRAEDCKVSPK